MPGQYRTGPHAAALRALSIFMGVFLIFMSLDKIGWLTDSGFLIRRLEEWRGAGGPLARWYVETIALPGAPLFARLVMLAELAAGLALLAGFWVRMAGGLALVMVLNFHIASDVIVQYSYLTNGYGLPVLGALLALAIGGTRLPFSAST